MEADPGTFDAGRLREYMDLGLSRFSVGVQAFQEACVSNAPTSMCAWCSHSRGTYPKPVCMPQV